MMNEAINAKLADAVQLWAEHNLDGKPALLANAFYFSLTKFFEDKAAEINNAFKG
jgi:hypothetical protein